VLEQLKLDLEVEKAAVKAVNAGIELSRSLDDNGSRELLERILIAEEEHANWIEGAAHPDRPGRRSQLPGPADPRRGLSGPISRSSSRARRPGRARAG
jgi:hypothetical protein